MAWRIETTNFTPTPKKRPAKRADYLKFLHELPCVVTGNYGVQAAHISYQDTWYGHYGRGKGTKAPDRFALPLCPEQHDLQHSCKLGTEREYWLAKGINPHELANTLWGIFSDYAYDEAVARCTARINQGLALSGRLRERIEQ
ncbi:hypothetical protein A6U86_05670 [Rhizobium sp. AC27/96]|uniref:DUF968 domain-containing protein n=1 Tax=Rhizobium sp. AC27/96 TaxID=1841653 RepID=UPI0008288973|nr:DUF968 domain-containing protein [Rhizobium sp. AC27/96]OCJ12511.1 hypothetical protein A6U86_05670 [Rhizobium sp. AC27/96]